MRKRCSKGSVGHPEQKSSEADCYKSVAAQEIIDGLKVVCICKGIRKSAFLKHIRAGASTVRELQRATGAGSGSCKGDRCTPRIEELVLQCEPAGEGQTSTTPSHQKKR